MADGLVEDGHEQPHGRADVVDRETVAERGDVVPEQDRHPVDRLVEEVVQDVVARRLHMGDPPAGFRQRRAGAAGRLGVADHQE